MTVLYLNLFECIPVKAKLNFLQSLLQSSALYDPSEIILIWSFAPQEAILIIINIENSCVA